jgi:hypothetical protein
MNQQRATIIINRTPEEARLERENFMRRHGGKTAVDLMHDRRFELLKKQMGIFDKPAWQLMLDDFQNRVARFTRQQFYYLPASLIPKSAFKASKSLKQKSELLAVLIGFLFLNTYQLTPNNGAINRILFSHFSRDNTSQIDSFASITH